VKGHPTTKEEWDQYARLAAEYYIAGRFAALAGWMPTCGNLMHHAVELQLKCGLMKAKAIPDLAQPSRWARFWHLMQGWLAKCHLAKRPANPPANLDQYFQWEYSHKLKKLWRDFKRCHAAVDLSAFDSMIRELDRWEEIRYPRLGIALGVQVNALPPPTFGGTKMRGVTIYTMSIEPVDQFMQRMYSVMGIGSVILKACFMRSPVARSIYEDGNVHRII